MRISTTKRCGFIEVFGILVIALATGCSKPEPAAPSPGKTDAPASKSASQTLIDGITGKSAVEAKKKAETQLNAVNASREEDMQEMDTLLGR